MMSSHLKAKVAYDDGYLYDMFNADARAFAYAQVQAGYVTPYGLAGGTSHP